MVKKIYSYIYLFDKMAVTSFTDMTVKSQNPKELALKYYNSGCDGIVVFDLSNNDEEHEASLDVIKEICDSIDVPVIGAGNVKRMEDIKKLLYAGCTKACLNYSKIGNIEITEEVSKKFGKDTIMASVANLVELEEHMDIAKEYVSEILFITPTSSADALDRAYIPMIVASDDTKPDKLLKLAKSEMLSGIVCNLDDPSQLKTFFEENGCETTKIKIDLAWEDLKKNSDGHICTVVQDVKTDEVLMVAYMNEEAYNRTINTGIMTYYSRSRDELWIKGETSGHYQYLQSLYVDCDSDTLLAKVTQVGAACHTGNHSCFYASVYSKDIKREDNPIKVFEQVYDIIKDRKIHPKEGSYTNYLFDKGIDKILKKLGEEATEIVIAAKNPNPNEIKYEISDFLYHMMVLMAEKEISWDEITEELAKR